MNYNCEFFFVCSHYVNYYINSCFDRQMLVKQRIVNNNAATICISRGIIWKFCSKKFVLGIFLVSEKTICYIFTYGDVFNKLFLLYAWKCIWIRCFWLKYNSEKVNGVAHLYNSVNSLLKWLYLHGYNVWFDLRSKNLSSIIIIFTIVYAVKWNYLHN